MDYHLAQSFSNSFFYELYVQSIHTNIPLCKTERKLTINITTLYNSITSHQKYLLVKKNSDKKNRFGTEVIKLVNNAYCTFSSRFQWWLLMLLKFFMFNSTCLCSLGVHIRFKVFLLKWSGIHDKLKVFSSVTRPCRRRVRRQGDSVRWCCSLTCTCLAGCPTPPRSCQPLTLRDLCPHDHDPRDLSGTGYLPCYRDLLSRLYWKKSHN